ncbi:ABC transporter substrate-binding protein, partial [Candidatus Falkowbacteria bacterium]|nr:ABC transporter substrate-binding protein [Candidatus Falkowbacteria bacterium]
MTMKAILMGAVAALAMGLGTASAEGVKVGMITTLSGGGAGLGVDTRDGFQLALKQAGDAAKAVELIIEDDQQKPDVAVQIADKMI